jgi:acetyltransferase-like isoleucine patch superfamily enzyme
MAWFHDKIYRVLGMIYYRRIFASFGKGSVVYKPMMLRNPQYIHIGDNVTIRQGARLEIHMLDPANPPELRIGNNVSIEQNFHLVLMGKVIIHDGAAISANCSLLGGNHPFFDVNNSTPIGSRITGTDSTIEIGAGSLIGINSVVGANVRIGKHVVVGSGSVVKKNVPDYSVVEGNPAVVVMVYDKAEDRWKIPAKP